MDEEIWTAEPQAQELANGRFAPRLALTRDDFTGVSVRLEDLEGEYDTEELALVEANREIARRAP